MTSELVVSVSGITERTIADLDGFRAELRGRGVPLSLFVAPRRKGGYRLDADAVTSERLRRYREGGDAMVLHGFDGAATKRFRSEFATLPAHEANLRLLAADRTLEHLGLRTRLFAAPGWTISPGTVKALPRSGFRLAIGLYETVDLVRGIATRSRVVGIGAGFLKEPWWCRAVVLSAERTARRGSTVRLAVSAGQLGRTGPRQALLDAVDLAIMHGCRPGVYRWNERPALAGAA